MQDQTDYKMEIFNKASKSSLEPLFDNQFEAVFPVENEVLSNQVKSISQGSITFELNVDEQNRVIPLKEVIALTKVPNSQLRINMFDKNGDVHLTIVYYNVNFHVHIEQLMYHDYQSVGIKELTVFFGSSHYQILDENKVEIYTTKDSNAITN